MDNTDSQKMNKTHLEEINTQGLHRPTKNYSHISQLQSISTNKVNRQHNLDLL